ncbi:hypothetical protein JW962_01110 [Candidatus Dojkabacteria bacterium]|nr:hypothetical protein [Candidatus Dojkabacteria bacterium]
MWLLRALVGVTVSACSRTSQVFVEQQPVQKSAGTTATPISEVSPTSMSTVDVAKAPAPRAHIDEETGRVILHEEVFQAIEAMSESELIGAIRNINEVYETDPRFAGLGVLDGQNKSRTETDPMHYKELGIPVGLLALQACFGTRLAEVHYKDIVGVRARSFVRDIDLFASNYDLAITANRIVRYSPLVYDMLDHKNMTLGGITYFEEDSSGSMNFRPRVLISLQNISHLIDPFLRAAQVGLDEAVESFKQMPNFLEDMKVVGADIFRGKYAGKFIKGFQGFRPVLCDTTDCKYFTNVIYRNVDEYFTSWLTRFEIAGDNEIEELAYQCECQYDFGSMVVDYLMDKVGITREEVMGILFTGGGSMGMQDLIFERLGINPGLLDLNDSRRWVLWDIIDESANSVWAAQAEKLPDLGSGVALTADMFLRAMKEAVQEQYDILTQRIDEHLAELSRIS